MATNKELVEQAVKAIPQWMAFLEKKQAEQALILEQMQDEEAQFAPKSLTQRLTDRFRSAPEPVDTVNDKEDNRVKLEKETSRIEEEEIVEEKGVAEETEVVEETEEVEESESDSVAQSNDGDKQQISNESFKDVF